MTQIEQMTTDLYYLKIYYLRLSAQSACYRVTEISDFLSLERNGCFATGLPDEYLLVVLIIIRIDMCAVVFPGNDFPPVLSSDNALVCVFIGDFHFIGIAVYIDRERISTLSFVSVSAHRAVMESFFRIIKYPVVIAVVSDGVAFNVADVVVGAFERIVQLFVPRDREGFQVARVDEVVSLFIYIIES